MIFSRSFFGSIYGIGLGLFAVLSVLELLLPGFATNLVPMPALALAVITLGIIAAFRTPPKPPKTAAFHALPTAGLAALTLLLVWLTLAPLGTLAYLAAIAAAVAAGISVHILLTTKTE